ncbi:MAG: SDR family oxidoreductase [Pseudomonadota bacterium]
MEFLTEPFLTEPERFDAPVLVTGAGGCIGAWVMAILTRSGVPAIAFDRQDDRRRPALILGEAAAAELTWETGDIADGPRLAEIAERHGVGAIIHLAGLQVPFCKANPAAGARVNVEGTIQVLELARARGIRRLAFASSVAALGMPPGGPYLATLYGAYKLANEQTAQVYWQDWQVPSVGIRPNVVYGVGRDQGMTSMGTQAILAAMRGEAFEIPYAGRTSWLYAGEAAAAFIAAVARPGTGAPVFDLNGRCETVEAAMALLADLVPGADVRVSGPSLGFPPDLDDRSIRAHLGPYPDIPVADGIAATHRAFQALIAEGRL